MVVTELDSFVQKFHQLWKAGLTAHLDLDTHAGHAWVGLRAQLGRVPGPPHHEVSKTFHKKKQDSPSRQQRCERCAAAWNFYAEEAENTVEVNLEVLDEQFPDTAERVEEIQNSREESIEEIVVNERTLDEEATNDVTGFTCDICDSKLKNLKGLRNIFISASFKMFGGEVEVKSLTNSRDLYPDPPNNEQIKSSVFWMK